MEAPEECSKISEFKDENFFLSNFYKASTMYEGLIYPTSEHAYVAAKTTNPHVREELLEIVKPGEAKRFGRAIQLRPDWEQVKLGIMHVIVLDKFTRNITLNCMLRETQQVWLEEGNWWNDRYWGVCKGEGENHLGLILMNVRRALQG